MACMSFELQIKLANLIKEDQKSPSLILKNFLFLGWTSRHVIKPYGKSVAFALVLTSLQMTIFSEKHFPNLSFPRFVW